MLNGTQGVAGWWRETHAFPSARWLVFLSGCLSFCLLSSQVPSSGNQWHIRYFPTNKTLDSIYDSLRIQIPSVYDNPSYPFHSSAVLHLHLPLECHIHIQTFTPSVSQRTKRINSPLQLNANEMCLELFYVEQMRFSFISRLHLVSHPLTPTSKDHLAETQSYLSRILSDIEVMRHNFP